MDKQENTMDIERVREIVYNDITIGKLDGELFAIVPGWDIIRELNKLVNDWDFTSFRVCYKCKLNADVPGCDSRELGGHHSPYHVPSDKLELEQILGMVISDFPFPFPITQSQINTWNAERENWLKRIRINRQLNSGQLQLANFPQFELGPFPLTMTQGKILRMYRAVNQDIDKLNEDIKSQIPEVDWGFDDQFGICTECHDTIFETSPSSYSWTPEYYETDYDILCKECAQDSIEDAIEAIQDRIKCNKQPRSLPWIFNLSDKWHKIQSNNYNGRWENSMHRGHGKDDPLKQGKIIQNIVDAYNRPVFDVIFRIYPSQFEVEWETWIRINPNQDTQLTPTALQWYLEEYFSAMFESPEGQFKHNYGDLMAAALKDNSGGRFRTIDIDQDTGEIDIYSTNDWDVYTNQT